MCIRDRSLPEDETPEGRQRKQLREWVLQSYANAVDPDSPDLLFWEGELQPLVDAAYLAHSFLRGYEQLWVPLSLQTKQRYIERFKRLRRIAPPYNNWLMFPAIIETFLLVAGETYDLYRITLAINKMEEWYVGDGWYSDGPLFAFDYYNSYVDVYKRQCIYRFSSFLSGDAGRQYTHGYSFGRGW